MNSEPSKKDVPLQQLRHFGWLMTGFFGVIAAWPLVFRDEEVRMWAFIIASIFALLGMVFPNGLKPVYRGWMIFGEKIGWVNSRILLGLVFYGLVTPIAFLMLVLGKRPLKLRFDSTVDTYRELKEPRAADHVLKAF